MFSCRWPRLKACGSISSFQFTKEQRNVLDGRYFAYYWQSKLTSFLRFLALPKPGVWGVGGSVFIAGSVIIAVAKWSVDTCEDAWSSLTRGWTQFCSHLVLFRIELDGPVVFSTSLQRRILMFGLVAVLVSLRARQDFCKRACVCVWLQGLLLSA